MLKKGKLKKIDEGEIELLDESDQTFTGEFIPKGFLLFKHIDRLNRIQCLTPMDINLFCSAVDALNICMASDIAINKKFQRGYSALEKDVKERFSALPKFKQQQLYKNYQLYYSKELLKMLIVLIHERGYFRSEYST